MVDHNMSILTVDDFATMRTIIRTILNQLGFRNIEEADDGKTALAKLKKNKYDFVISDWNMPNMSGLDLLRSMKSDKGLKNIPFIMVTAEAIKENIIVAIQAGADDYIVKPFSADTLGKKIKHILG